MLLSLMIYLRTTVWMTVLTKEYALIDNAIATLTMEGMIVVCMILMRITTLDWRKWWRYWIVLEYLTHAIQSNTNWNNR